MQIFRIVAQFHNMRSRQWLEIWHGHRTGSGSSIGGVLLKRATRDQKFLHLKFKISGGRYG
jgi:hypothetical protein